MMMTRWRLSRAAAATVAALGLSVALAGCGTVYDLPLPGGANVGSNPLKIHVMFRDVADLVPQSTVKVNDVTVGRVTAISLTTVTTGCAADAAGGKCQVADVTVEIPSSTKLPANAIATIRQTSLLGEKFVSLCSPGTSDCASGTPQGALANGATIGLDNSGSNPEVEQVLEAMGALLSGGGVGQLKVISEELNKAIGGKEGQVRDLLTNLHSFMGQLDQNKAQIVTAIDNLNRLAVTLAQQDPTISSALDNIPAALASVNGQRADLEKMLAALSNLSGIGVQVIQASKAATISSLTNLAPVLSQLAATGNNLPQALQILLTYPFIDAAVGTTPAAAQKFAQGDYTNLSINVNLDLAHLVIPGLPTTTLGGLAQTCNSALSQAAALCNALGVGSNVLCTTLLKGSPVCDSTSTSPTTPGPTSPGGGSPSPSPTPPAKPCTVPNPLGGPCLIPRAAFDPTASSAGTVTRTPNDGMSYMLLQGAMQ